MQYEPTSVTSGPPAEAHLRAAEPRQRAPSALETRRLRDGVVLAGRVAPAAGHVSCQKSWMLSMQHAESLPLRVPEWPDSYISFWTAWRQVSTTRPSATTEARTKPTAGGVTTTQRTSASPARHPRPRSVRSKDTAGQYRGTTCLWTRRHLLDTRQRRRGLRYEHQSSPECRHEHEQPLTATGSAVRGSWTRTGLQRNVPVHTQTGCRDRIGRHRLRHPEHHRRSTVMKPMRRARYSTARLPEADK